MSVTRRQIVCRGLTNRCPNCGGRTLFRSDARFKLNTSCPSCGLTIERDDEGFFLGSLSLNYGATLVFFFVPMMALLYEGTLGEIPALIVCGIGAILVPILLYRSSRSWWLMQYYFFLPHHLPANRPASAPPGDQNL